MESEVGQCICDNLRGAIGRDTWSLSIYKCEIKQSHPKKMSLELPELAILQKFYLSFSYLKYIFITITGYRDFEIIQSHYHNRLAPPDKF